MNPDKAPRLGRSSAPVAHRRRVSFENVDSPAEDSKLARPSFKCDLTRDSLRTYLEKRSMDISRYSVSRAQQELAQRSTAPVVCRMSLSLTESESGRSVHYKYDGSRFQFAEATLKVVRGAVYDVRLVTKPDIDVVKDVLFVRAVTSTGKVLTSVINLRKSLDGEKGACGKWCCDFDSSAKGERMSIKLSGQLQEFGDFMLPLLMKVYPDARKHAVQGFRLKWIVFEVNQETDIQTGLARLDAVRYMS